MESTSSLPQSTALIEISDSIFRFSTGSDFKEPAETHSIAGEPLGVLESFLNKKVEGLDCNRVVCIHPLFGRLSERSFLRSLTRSLLSHFQAVSLINSAVAAAFGCNISNCIAINLTKERVDVSAIHDFSLINAASESIKISDDFAVESIEDWVNDEFFPNALLPVYRKTPSQWRRAIFTNLILHGETFETKAKISDSFGQVITRCIDQRLCCHSPLAGEGQVQEVMIASLPYYLTEVHGKQELCAWVGGWIYSQACFEDDRFYFTRSAVPKEEMDDAEE